MEVLSIQSRIYEIRGHKVMLDFDLADLYNVETKNLNLAVKRNPKRFPSDFMFRLSEEEWSKLRLQIATSNQRGGTRYLPYAFTEQGVSMLSSILRSDRAIEVNITIMRTFVFLRQYALSHQELTEKLHALESKYDLQFKDVYEAIHFLLEKEKQSTNQSTRKRIGFHKTRNI